MTALHWAAFHGRTGHVKKLVEKKADLISRDTDGKLPLHWAAQVFLIASDIFFSLTFATVYRHWLEESTYSTVADYMHNVDFFQVTATLYYHHRFHLTSCLFHPLLLLLSLITCLNMPLPHCTNCYMYCIAVEVWWLREVDMLNFNRICTTCLSLSLPSWNFLCSPESL